MFAWSDYIPKSVNVYLCFISDQCSTGYFSIYHSLKYLSILSYLILSYLSIYRSINLSVYLAIYLSIYVLGPINPQQADAAEVWQTCRLLQRSSNQLRSQAGAVHGPDLREGGGRALLQRRLRADVSDPQQNRGPLGGGTKYRQIPHPTYFKVFLSIYFSIKPETFH